MTGTPVSPLRERPVPIGCRVIDQTLGGLVPGALTVVTADRDVRAAIAAQLIRRIARAGSLVALVSQSDTAGELVRRMGSACESNVIGVPGLPADVGRLGRYAPRVRLVVGWDADRAAAAPAWRLLAARLAVPALVCMSGSRPGWADPRDSHLECFRTHAGPFARFVARGVPAFGGEPRRVAIGVDAETVRVLSGKTLFLRLRGTRWAPARDFDGVLCSRPTVMTAATLAAHLREPAWTPVDDFEAAATLEAIAAAVVTGAPVAADDRVREIIGRCAAVIGQPASRIWARALAAMCGPDLARPIAQATRFDLHPSTFDGYATRPASAWKRSRT